MAAVLRPARKMRNGGFERSVSGAICVRKTGWAVECKLCKSLLAFGVVLTRWLLAFGVQPLLTFGLCGSVDDVHLFVVSTPSSHVATSRKLAPDVLRLCCRRVGRNLFHEVISICECSHLLRITVSLMFFVSCFSVCPSFSAPVVLRKGTCLMCGVSRFSSSFFDTR